MTDIPLSAEALACALDGKWTGTQGTARCPAHNDSNPSLSISENPKGGNPLVYCHAGCDQKAVIGTLKQRGLWANNRKGTSPEQIRKHRQQAKQAKIKRQATDAEKHERSAAEAQDMWNRAQPAPDSHTYLKQKRIKPYNLRATANGELLAPVYDRDGKLSSVQRIYEYDGKFEKRNLEGGAFGGDRHFVIGGPGEYLSGNTEGMEAICTAEGVATAASIHEATGQPTVVAFSANKLEPVARLARQRYPNARITVCADNDGKTAGEGKGNPGVEAATKAAQAVGAHLATPPAAEGESVDFNDLAVAKGLDAVNDEIKAAEEQPSMVKYPPAANDDEAPRKEYPIEDLPEKLRNAITEVQKFVQSPLPMTASSAISMLSLAAQHLFDMERASGLKGPIGLFMVTVAESGERKTSNDKIFQTPILEFEKEIERESREEVQIYKAKHEQWKAQGKAIINKNTFPKNTSSKKEFVKWDRDKKWKVGESSMISNEHILQMEKSLEPAQIEKDAELIKHATSEPEKPRTPQLIYQDTTSEALLWGLRDTWPSAGVLTSEGNIVFGSYSMNDKSIQKTLGNYNSLWDGDEATVNRRTSESFKVRDARLTLSIQVQEAPLREFISRNKGLVRGTGFLARWLFTHPESTKGTRMYKEAPSNWPARSKFFSLIKEILEHNKLSEKESTREDEMPRRTLRFDKEAQALWTEFHNTNEVKLGKNGKYEEVSDLASKVADNMARLAALFQIVIDGPKVVETVGVQATQGAIAVMEWYLDEALRFLGSASIPESIRDADSILAWMKTKKIGSISKRDLQRSVAPREIRAKDRFREALDELVDQGDIEMERRGKKLIVTRV